VNESSVKQRPTIPFYRDERVLRVIGQVIFVAAILFLGYSAYANLVRGAAKFGNPFNFSFLVENVAGFALAETPIDYEPTVNTYFYAFLVGAINTLRVVIVGILLASVFGLVMGVARLSSNWLIAKIAQVYVELFRNIPLLIQLSFWYFAIILRLPRVRESMQAFDSIFLSNRGLVIPWFAPAASFVPWLIVLVIALALAIGVYVLLGRLPEASPARVWRGLWVFFGFAIIAIASGYLLDAVNPTVPKIQGFNYVGGLTLSPEYVGMVFGLVMYTGAFIAEIVRAGIQAVPRGLNEASRALGLTYTQTLRLVTVPLALRVIIPPLTNQYLNLSKNSSLAVVIGYADLYYVGNTIFNQSGQTLQIVSMIMGTYLVMSLLISLVMNQVNRQFKLVER
jgi:general L-amino acid transport system permease protein